jgi:hypothetical protein
MLPPPPLAYVLLPTYHVMLETYAPALLVRLLIYLAVPVAVNKAKA